MYVAVKGGETAIDNAHELMKKKRRGNPATAELSVKQIREQLKLAVDRVMAEGSLYDPELAALAIKQASGDLIEAIFLLRAYRTTLPRFVVTQPLITADMSINRRISATFKDIPGGQLLGPTYDYTHRLLDFTLLAESEPFCETPPEALPAEALPAETRSAETLSGREREPEKSDNAVCFDASRDGTVLTDPEAPNIQHAPTEESVSTANTSACYGTGDEPGILDNPDTDGKPGTDDAPQTRSLYPGVLGMLNQEGLIEDAGKQAPGNQPVPDLTREPLSYPADRETRLQALARGDEGYLLALGYSTQRGYGRNHPFAGEIRQGEVALSVIPEELGFEVDIGVIEITECEMINQFVGSKSKAPVFTRGYGLVFGYNERKALSMALVDRALRADEFGEEQASPAQQQEFVLSHSDNVEASGFVSHLKLPHYVDFQAELELLRKLRQQFQQQQQEAELNGDDKQPDKVAVEADARNNGSDQIASEPSRPTRQEVD